ncbi:MAG: hypothetical protein KHX91_04595 [Clostridium sp.]|nr:hypothetical protein [Clostridium sp.]
MECGGIADFSCGNGLQYLQFSCFKLSMGDDLKKSVESGILSALSYYKNKSLFSDIYCEFESLADIGLWKESQIRGSGYVLHTLQASLRCLLTTSCYTDCVLKAIHLEEDAYTTTAVAAVLQGFDIEYHITKSWLYKLVNIKNRKSNAINLRIVV